MRILNLARASVLLTVLGMTLTAGNAAAVSYGFGCISNNLASDCTIAEAQMLVDVLPVGGTQVEFVFTNSGPDASSITDVYFDDGSLLLINMIMNGAGVDFSTPSSPPNLPGGSSISPPFVTSVGFAADSVPPAEPNGVNPGEQLTILFDLIGGQIFSDVLTELQDGTLRIGIHVQGFSSTGSEGLVNIPEPGTGLLMALGLGFLGARRRIR